MSSEIFYVGKGTKLRAWSKHGRNPLWKVITAKYEYTVEVVEDNLVAKVALELEEFVISYHKLKIFGGTRISATRRDFKQQIGIDPKQLFKTEKWRYKSVAGWPLSL